MNALQILLCRHGRAEHNFGNVFGGYLMDTKLTDAGIGDAHSLAERLQEKKVGLDLIISSSLERSKETARIIGECLGQNTPISSMPEFNEVNVGDFTGKTREEVEKLYPASAQYFYNRDLKNWNFPHGEDYTEITKRVDRGLSLISQKIPHGTILIVGHAMLNCVLLANLFPEHHEYLHELSFHHDLIVPIINEDGRWKLEKQF